MRIEALESRRLLSGSPFSGPLQAVPGAPQDAIAGETVVSGTLASVTGVDTSRFFAGTKNLSSPNYIVRWGDGSSPTISFTDVGPAGELDALVPAEGHVYRRAGDYVMHVAFLWQGRIVAHVREGVHVDQNSSNGVTLHAVAGQPISAVLGTFTNPTGYSISPADVFWGDSPGPVPKGVQNPPSLNRAWGSYSPASLQQVGSGTYEVSGDHSYTRPGVYRVRVAVESNPPDPTIVWNLSEEAVVFSTIIVSNAK